MALHLKNTHRASYTTLMKPVSRDATVRFPETFACALRMPVSQEAIPNLTLLLRRGLMDEGLATCAAKDKCHQRRRPFATFKNPSCTPKEKAYLAKEGSYSSGHTALTWK